MRIHRIRKIIAISLAALVLAFVPAVEIQAESNITKDGFTYFLVNDPHQPDKYLATITGYSGSKSNVRIPENISNAYVKHIADRAFFGISSLTAVTMQPEGDFLSIGNFAFGDCSNLAIVNLSDLISSIGINAFSGCSSLKSIVLPNNTLFKNISAGAFERCSSLSSIVIPPGVTYIGGNAFSQCSSLTSLDIPSTVTKIGDAAFSECSGLASLDIPSSVSSIGYKAFLQCSSLTSLVIPPSVTEIGEYAFIGCDALTIKGYTGSYAEQYAITNGIPFFALDTSSREEMFSFKADLDSVTVTGFNGLDAIITVPTQLKGMAVKRIGPGAFRDMTTPINIIIPTGVIGIGDQAFFGCSNLKTVSLPLSLTDIGDWSFSKCVSLTVLDIPTGVKSIGAGAFSGCTSLASVTIPFGVTGIGEAAFRKCTGLESVEISFSVTSIGDYAFYGCSSLKKVTIPSRVSSIGKDAFLYTPAVIHGYAGSYAEAYAQEHFIPFVVIDTQASGITESGFSYDINGDELTITGYADSDIDITLPEFIEGIPVTGIGERIFSANGKDCSIASLTVPSGITRIDGNAFDGCPGLTIFGYKGSNLETYARNASIPFTALDEQTEPAPPPYQELTLGSHGQAVLDMKGRFLELGYFRTAEFSDQFNKNTADTVRLFETNNGLPADGVADPMMLALLFSDRAVGK